MAATCLVFWVSIWALTYLLEHASNGNLIGRALWYLGFCALFGAIGAPTGAYWHLMGRKGLPQFIWLVSLSGEGMWWDPSTGALNCLVSQGRRRVWGP